MLRISETEKRGMVAILAAAMLLMGSIHSSNTSWNVNSRMATVFAVVERGTFAIDGYDGDADAFPTMDKATFNGHFYSDKAIGVSLLGVPVYAAIVAVSRLTGIEWDLQLKIYAIRIAVASIPAAIALCLIWLILTRERVPPRRAFFAVAAIFCGSWLFGYSTLSMPYAPGVAACLGAIALLLYPQDGRLSVTSAAAIGGLCGFSLICDLTFALMVAPIVVMFLSALLTDRPRALTLAAAGAASGAAPLALYAAYTYSIFGQPTIPYYYIVVPLFREGIQQGLLGIGWPRLGAAWFLTVHPYRGVFFWSPWVVLSLIGCVMSLRVPGHSRTFGLMGLWAFSAYLAMASGYYMWWGGWSMGARLMSPMLAALPFGLIPVLRRERSRIWWSSFVATASFAMLLCVPLSIINPQVEEGNSYQRLRWARVGDSLDVPQFRYLRMCYSGEWFRGQTPRHVAIRILPFIALLGAGGTLAYAAARQPRIAG